jgi:hypothetical protein
MEPLWLGTTIKLLEAIEESEAQSIDALLTANEALLMNDDEATTTQLLSQILDMFNTPTQNPAMTQADIIDIMVDVNQAIVRLMGLNTEQQLLNAFTSDIVGP